MEPLIDKYRIAFYVWRTYRITKWMIMGIIALYTFWLLVGSNSKYPQNKGREQARKAKGEWVWSWNCLLPSYYIRYWWRCCWIYIVGWTGRGWNKLVLEYAATPGICHHQRAPTLVPWLNLLPPPKSWSGCCLSSVLGPWWHTLLDFGQHSGANPH